MNDLIFGEGYDSADLMFIGDYARKYDSTSGRCLSGYYKQKLGELLKPTDFHIDSTYRTCIIKNYIQSLGVGDWRSDKKILETCWEIHELSPLTEYLDILIDEILTVKPLVIIALGEFAIRTLTDKEGIYKWRGSIVPLAPDIQARLNDPRSSMIKVLCSYHIGIIHEQQELTYIIRGDFKKAASLLQDQRPIDYHEVHIARNSMDVMRFNDLYPYEKYPDMSYDIETHRGFITCAGYSFDGYRGITIPMIGASSPDLIDRCRMIWLLSQLLSERNLINQNIGYDRRISQRFGLMMPKIKWDTMLAANIIAAEFPKDLGFLTSIYTDMSYYKDEGREFDPSMGYDQLYGYNCKDAISAFQIYKKQEADLIEMELIDFFNNFIMSLFYMYYDIDSSGLPISMSKKDELNAKYTGLYNLKYMELCAITSPMRLNMNSPSQIGKFMEEQKFPVLRHRVASGFMVPNTDIESLRKMRIADPIEYRRCNLPYDMSIRFINLVLLLRRLDKILEYLSVDVHPWGRIHTSYKIGGTRSGRTSAGQTPDQWPIYYYNKKDELKLKWENMGQSFQTVTKHGFIVEGDEDVDISDGIIGNDIREIYIPDPGWALIEIDGSQAEARVCDVLGEDWESLAEYSKIDKHCKTASLIFTDYSYEEIFRLAKREKTAEGIFMRNIGKHAKHAKNNGLEYYQLAVMYVHLPDFHASLKLSKEILQKVDKAYPNIEKVFHKQVEDLLRSQRMLITPRAYGNPCGRKRMFFKKIDKHYLNVAYSYLPQSTVTDHTKAAALRILSRIDRMKAYLIAENHDSLTAMVHRSYIREYCTIAKKELERPIDFRACSLPRDYELVIPAEFSIGRKSWGEMKEVKKFKTIKNTVQVVEHH